jgi:4-hydroxy-tetrahydrodipicolinate synthase
MAKIKKGYIPVMLTPFKDNGDIDYKGLTKITELYLESGVSGLFANCLSSEMYELNEQERVELVKHVIKIVDGRVPVVATGSFGGTLEIQADFIKKMHDTGVNAVIVITGIMAGIDEADEVLNDRIFQLLRLTGEIKLGLYECPVPYKRIISAEQLKKFVGTNRITYLKDTCLNLEQVRAKLEAVNDYRYFSLYDAYMVHAVESLKAGSAGLSCIQGNFFPELIIWLCKNYDEPGLKNEVLKVQEVLANSMDLVHDVYPIVAKYFLQKRGVDISIYTRRQVGMFTGEIKTKIDTLYADFSRLQNELQIDLAGYSF